MSEKDNVFKIKVPIISNQELNDINNFIHTDYENIIEKISETVSRDKEIIILQQVIKNQYEKIKKAEKHIIEYKQKYEEASGTIELIKRNINYLYISKDEIREKINYYRQIDNIVAVRILEKLLGE